MAGKDEKGWEKTVCSRYHCAFGCYLHWSEVSITVIPKKKKKEREERQKFFLNRSQNVQEHHTTKLFTGSCVGFFFLFVFVFC